MTKAQILAHLEKETAIQANKTARYRGKYECRDDPRPSSKLVGLIGTAIVASMFWSHCANGCPHSVDTSQGGSIK